VNSQARQEDRQGVQERLLISKDVIAYRADSTDQETSSVSQFSRESKKTGKRRAPMLGFWSEALFPRAEGTALDFDLLGHDSAIL